MTSLASDTLARVRVCRTAGLPFSSELQEHIEQCLEQMVSPASLRGRRDVLIRRAALTLPAASLSQRANMLVDEAKQLGRVWHLLRNQPPEHEPATPRACLHAAALLAELPASARQFYRVLSARNF